MPFANAFWTNQLSLPNLRMLLMFLNFTALISKGKAYIMTAVYLLQLFVYANYFLSFFQVSGFTISQ